MKKWVSMNKIIAKIIEIKSLERLNLVKCKVNAQIVNVLLLELNLDLEIGKKVELIIKPTAISISKQKCVFENVLKAKIKEIEKGEIISSILVDVEGFRLEILMLSELVDFEDEVYVLFKSNDVAINKVL